MIEGIDTTQGAPRAGTGRPAAGSPTGSGSSFAAVMSAASAADDRLERLRREIRPPRGERWEAVPGHSGYADIVSGPRNGWYINLQEGPRQGEVFHIVRKDGREFHVYGEGRDRHTIEVKRSDDRRSDRKPGSEPAETVSPREGETFELVGRHQDYKRIEGGERDDLFINVSGNERHGRAFRIEERDDQRWHVYGSGDDKIEVRVGWRNDAQKRDDADAQAREDD